MTCVQFARPVGQKSVERPQAAFAADHYDLGGPAVRQNAELGNDGRFRKIYIIKLVALMPEVLLLAEIDRPKRGPKAFEKMIRQRPE